MTYKLLPIAFLIWPACFVGAKNTRSKHVNAGIAKTMTLRPPSGRDGQKPPNKKYVRLFNGRDLTGWTIHGTEKWYIRHGRLICENGPDKEYGYLSTNKNYKNFILTLQFKQVKNGNSGVFIRSSIEGIKISGWQVEVAPIGLHTGGIYESYGRGWLKLPAPEDENNLRVGKWNKMRIKVNGDTVTSWLNGKKMVSLTDEKIGKGTGFIALQIHNGGDIKIIWKNILIKEL
jgi:hypothetical protein